jgi:hypothetical protein
LETEYHVWTKYNECVLKGNILIFSLNTLLYFIFGIRTNLNYRLGKNNFTQFHCCVRRRFVVGLGCQLWSRFWLCHQTVFVQRRIFDINCFLKLSLKRERFEPIFFKGPLCLRNAIILISQNLFIFSILLQFPKILICHIYELSFSSFAFFAIGMFKVNKYFILYGNQNTILFIFATFMTRNFTFSNAYFSCKTWYMLSIHYFFIYY